MAASPRKQQRLHGFDRKTLRPARSFFYVNGQLVKLIHKSKAHNLAYVFNYPEQKEQVILLTDFVKRRERAFSIAAAAWVLGYSKDGLYKNILHGNIPRPYYLTPDGKVAMGYRAYYSESQLYELRELLSYIDRGAPRKDGKPVSRTISEGELRYRLGHGMLLYTQGLDGEMVPVWSESI